jgi:PQQ-dependent catabolism-associated CXXCW motif protein
MRRYGVAALILLALAGSLGAQELPAGVDAVTGFRMDRYRAPTPPAAPGAVTVDAATVRDLAANGAVLLDVMAHQGGGTDPKTGEWRIQKPRDHIPGSTWLPDTGVGAPSPLMLRYLRDNLERLAGPPPGKPIVVYCMADCWMSWNASRRIAAMGYAGVHWFREGTDGWRDAGLDIVPAAPPPPVPVE